MRLKQVTQQQEHQPAKHHPGLMNQGRLWLLRPQFNLSPLGLLGYIVMARLYEGLFTLALQLFQP